MLWAILNQVTICMFLAARSSDTCLQSMAKKGLCILHSPYNLIFTHGLKQYYKTKPLSWETEILIVWINLIKIKIECVCVWESPMHAQTSLQNRLKIWGEAPGIQADVINGDPRPPKPPRATEDSPVSRFSKFLFEKVVTGMYYVHAKNIGRHPHPVETALKLPNTHLWADFQNLFF